MIYICPRVWYTDLEYKILRQGVDRMKRLTSIVLVIALLLLSTGSVLAASVPGAVYTDQTVDEIKSILQSARVKDVNSDDWYAPGISALIRIGLIAPDSSGNINPQATNNGLEAVSIVAKAVGIANRNDSPETAFQKAKEAGIVGDGITMLTIMRRIDVAYMVAKAFNLPYISIYNRNLFPFADFLAFTPGERGMVKALTERGIFTGYAIGGGKYEFRPNNTITKAEFATVVARLMNLI